MISRCSAETLILDRLGRLIVQFFVRPLPQRRQRLVAGDRQEPCRNLRPCFETVGLAPDVEKHFTDEVFRLRRFTHQPQDKPVDANVMPGEQNLHRELVAGRDPSDQRFV